MESALLTTDEVIEHLAFVGLRINRGMLALDVQGGFLPQRLKNGRGNRSGVGRLWEPWVLRRAVYLYRLRKRGYQGDLLRVLLFLRDGWGWDQVRPICLTGFQKSVKSNKSMIHRHLRQPTPKALAFVAEDIASEVPMKLPTALFTMGLGLFGKPLEGGSMSPLWSALQSLGFGNDVTNDEMAGVEDSIAHSGITWDSQAEIVERASSAEADRARQILVSQLRSWRRYFRSYCRLHGIGLVESTNILTMCGKSAREVQRFFRSSPGRMTPAQTIAFLLAPCLTLEHINWHVDK